MKALTCYLSPGGRATSLLKRYEVTATTVPFRQNIDWRASTSRRHPNVSPGCHRAACEGDSLLASYHRSCRQPSYATLNSSSPIPQPSCVRTNYEQQTMVKSEGKQKLIRHLTETRVKILKRLLIVSLCSIAGVDNLFGPRSISQFQIFPAVTRNLNNSLLKWLLLKPT